MKFLVKYELGYRTHDFREEIVEADSRAEAISEIAVNYYPHAMIDSAELIDLR
jgi:hypothetical protein